MTGRNLIYALLITTGLSACTTNPTKFGEFDNSIADRAIEVNEAYNAELNGQILKNILRARDRQPRFYTSMSALSMTPSAKLSDRPALSGVNLGNPTNPWGVFSFGQSHDNANQMTLTISPDAKKAEAAELIYHSPIKINTFLTYYNDWDSNVVDNLMLDQIREVDPGKTSGGQSVVDNILADSDGMFRVFIGDGYNGIRLNDVCDLANNCQLLEANYCIESAACRRNNDNSINLSGQNFASVRSFTKDLNRKLKDISIREKGALFVCELSYVKAVVGGTPTDVGMYDCKVATAATSIDGSRPASLIYVGVIDAISSERTMYALTLSSIDNMIFRLADSLQPTGKGWRSDIPTKDGNDFFKIDASGSSATSGCKARYAARVTHHNTTYYSGPPERFGNSSDLGNCYKNDSSGTVLTLIAELIKLREVSAELVTPGLFISN